MNYQPYLTKATYLVGPASELAFGLVIDVTTALSANDTHSLLTALLNAHDADLVTVKASRDEWDRVAWLLAHRAIFTVLNDTPHYTTPVAGTRGLDRGILLAAIDSVMEDDRSLDVEAAVDPTLLRQRAHRHNSPRAPEARRQDDRLADISNRLEGKPGTSLLDIQRRGSKPEIAEESIAGQDDGVED